MTTHPEGVLEPVQCHRCGKELSAASGYAMNATCDLFFCLVRCHAPEPASPPPADREENPGWWRKDIPRPHKRKDGIPTRIDSRWHTTAERAITAAMGAIERAGASLKLTEAVTLLSKARDCVADHVEGDR